MTTSATSRPAIPHPVLTTPRLRLRQVRPDDTDAMHEAYSNPEAMRFWDRPVHTKRIETVRAVRNSIKCTPAYYRVWAIADAATDRCLGMANYHNGNTRHKRAEIGYIIHPAYHRQGLATEAVSALLDHCLNDLGLHRLEARIEPDNTASRTLIEKLGFRREGLLRDSLRVDNTWRSALLYALLATERPT